MSMQNLWQYFLLPLVRPRKHIIQLLDDPKRLGYSSLIFLFLGVIYTLSVQLAYSRGLGAGVKPLLDIPAEDYYFYQRFWQIPFFFLTTLVFAGTVRLLADASGSRGSFIGLFCVLAVAQTLPMFLTMWLPETFSFLFFPGMRIWPVWVDIVRQVVGIIWPLAITVLGVAETEKVKLTGAILLTLAGSIPMVLLMVAFVR